MDPKDLENKTPVADGLGDEKKQEAGDDTPKTDAPKEVPLTPEEIAKLKKKADDFDGLIEKQRLSKLEKKEVKPVADDDVQNKIAELQAELNSFKADKANDNLKEAYQDFVKECPWATSDEYFNKISENFSADGLTSKEGIIAKLKATTINLFPVEYSQHKEKEIKAKALAEASQISAGGGSGNGVNNTAKDREVIDPLAKLKERFNSSLPKGFTATKK